MPGICGCKTVADSCYYRINRQDCTEPDRINKKTIKTGKSCLFKPEKAFDRRKFTDYTEKHRDKRKDDTLV